MSIYKIYLQKAPEIFYKLSPELFYEFNKISLQAFFNHSLRRSQSCDRHAER